MRFDLLHPADQLVMMMNRIYQFGMTTTSGGNLSIKDVNGDIWITPSGVDKGTLTRQDIMQVKPDGTIIGIHTPSVELPFHAQIYACRPDIRAIVHAHPPSLVAFSLVRRIPSIMLVPNVRRICGAVAVAEYEVPGSKELGARIAAQFDKGYNCIMMENHGAVVGASSLFEAFMSFEALENSAKLEIDANTIGTPRELTEEQYDLSLSKQMPALDAFVSNVTSSEECAVRRDMCTLIRRAYTQRLFSATQGTFAQRLPDGSFIITPFRKDRMYLEPEDLVRIKGGMCEAEKTPSRAVALVQKIFDKHPEVGSVIMAYPPSIMAFSVTDAVFDSRTIPESYIMLRDVKRLPFGYSFTDVEKTADVFCSKVPVVMLENDCVIAAGSSMLNAFDRLEVAEYSAKAIIAAKAIGELQIISDEEVKVIEKAFNLK